MPSFLPNPNIIKYDNFRRLRGYSGRNNSSSSCIFAASDFGQISEVFYSSSSFSFVAIVRFASVRGGLENFHVATCTKAGMRADKILQFLKLFRDVSVRIRNFHSQLLLLFCPEYTNDRVNTKICQGLISGAKSFNHPKKSKNSCRNECAINFWV